MVRTVENVMRIHNFLNEDSTIVYDSPYQKKLGTTRSPISIIFLLEMKIEKFSLMHQKYFYHNLFQVLIAT